MLIVYFDVPLHIFLHALRLFYRISVSVCSCYVVSFVRCSFVLLVSLVAHRSVTLRKSCMSVLSNSIVSKLHAFVLYVASKPLTAMTTQHYSNAF